MRTSLDDPFRELQRLRARLRTILDGTLPEPVPAPTPSEWTPRADVHATADAVRIELEVPGIAREDLDVSVHNNVLTVRGVRPQSSAGERFYQSERPCGKLSRSFSLGFEPGSVQADLSNGVLTISLTR